MILCQDLWVPEARPPLQQSNPTLKIQTGNQNQSSAAIYAFQRSRSSRIVSSPLFKTLSHIPASLFSCQLTLYNTIICSVGTVYMNE